MAAPLVRSARNQLLFREVNERIREVLDSQGDSTEFLCECSRDDCTETILLSLEEYDRIRSTPNHFLTEPGHELLGIERIVHQTDRFVTVELTAEAVSAAHKAALP
jgi:hypothetical protein